MEMPKTKDIPRWGPQGEEHKGTTPKLRLFSTLVPAAAALITAGAIPDRSNGGAIHSTCQVVLTFTPVSLKLFAQYCKIGSILQALAFKALSGLLP